MGGDALRTVFVWLTQRHRNSKTIFAKLLDSTPRLFNRTPVLLESTQVSARFAPIMSLEVKVTEMFA